MKREIKFRAWDSKSKKMVDLLKITPLALSDSMNTEMALQGMTGLFIPFERNTDIMQFTGLKDKNGKEIYESDIVMGKWGSGIGGKSTKYKEFNSVVYWSDARWNVKFHNDYKYRFYPSWQEYEVIGNIYENPELLK